MTGTYEGNKTSFRLRINGSELIVDDDDRNSLSIGYAVIGAIPEAQVNLAVMDDAKQNLTGGQKLLLHWHNRFGHLNLLAAIQGIFRAAVPKISAKSCTGYVIMYCGAPLLWVSKMQTQIVFSTKEAKYITLSQFMQDLIPIHVPSCSNAKLTLSITPIPRHLLKHLLA